MFTNNIQRSRLLLIEDDDGDAVLVERALERFPDFVLRHVTCMQAALEVLATESFDVALLDLSLPDSFGLEGVTKLQSQFPELPVVVLTGLDDRELPLEALERGAQDYLSKGQCSPENLIRSLRYAIQRQQIQGENRRLMGELALQARHDSLTGIINRRTLVAELDRQWHLAERSEGLLSCVMIDIDFFKRINDTLGHAAGDLVLQAIANQLSAGCRSGDVPGRYGGEEFLVLLPHTTEAGAIAWSERLRQAIAATRIDFEGHTIQVTASFGVAQRNDEVQHAEQFLERADQALRQAKELGRDQVISYQQTLDQVDGVDTDSQGAFSRLTAGEIMTPLVATLEESATLQEATEFLLNLRLDSAPIVDSDGKMVGIIGEEKLADVLTSTDAWCRPVAAVMKKKPVCFAIETSAEVIQDFLARAASRRVVILNQERPVGIVSRASILRWRDYHGLARRSLLAKLSQVCSSRDAQHQNLLALVTEIERQAARLAHRLIATDDPWVDLTIASATCIQSLLEDAVMQSQCLDSRDAGHATIGGMVG